MTKCVMRRRGEGCRIVSGCLPAGSVDRNLLKTECEFRTRAGDEHNRDENLIGGTIMCGIVGYVGEKQATDFLLEGLAKLEYRGYELPQIHLSSPYADEHLHQMDDHALPNGYALYP